jgi:hypothetical protein
MLSVLVVVIDVLCVLMKAVLAHHIVRRGIVCVELQRPYITPVVSNLLEQVAKPCFFSSLGESNVLSYCRRECNKM